MSKRIWNFVKAFRNKFMEVGIFKESAALTFVTVLGFVPFVIFILFFLPELPFLKPGAKFQDFLLSVFLPGSAEQISSYLQEIVSRKIPFNLFNFIVLLITSFSLFKIINDSFDNILNVHETRKQDFLSNFIKFLGMTIFGGLLILILFSATSISVVSKFIQIPFLQGITLYVTPLLLLFIIFSLGFFFIPTIKIRSRSIFIGSAISSIIWIIFKSFFNWYIINLTNMQLIFGVLASIPILLFWIYANWIIIFSGVIFVSILENRHHITAKNTVSNKLILTVEKEVADEVIQSKAITLNGKELKNILQEVLKEEEKTEE
jgi:membrane protein